MLASVPPLGYALASISVRKLNEELHWIYSLFYNAMGPPIIVIPLLILYPSIVHINSYTLKDVVGMLLVSLFELSIHILHVISLEFVLPT